MLFYSDTSIGVVENKAMKTLKFRYEFNKENKILYKQYYGNLTYEEIISSWEYAFKNNLIPEETKGFLMDYREASISSPIKEHVKLPEFFQQHLNIFGKRKMAVITNKPKDIVIPIMIKQKEYNFVSEPFSTEEGAIKWLTRD